MTKEEIIIEAKDLLISDEEYNILNTEFHSIIGKFIKQNIKDKDLAIAQHIIKKQEIENTNLKQALNDIYKYIKEKTREDMPNKKCLEENKIAYGTIKYIIEQVLGDG